MLGSVFESQSLVRRPWLACKLCLAKVLETGNRISILDDIGQVKAKYIEMVRIGVSKSRTGTMQGYININLSCLNIKINIQKQIQKEDHGLTYVRQLI